MISTAKLAGLGWEPTPPDTAFERTVEAHLDSDRDGARFDPGREREERLIEGLG